MRNPWRFSFDRLTGAFVLGDVGQGAWEEIDWRPIDVGWGRGVNFGWSCMEGRHLYNGNCPEPENHTPPIFEYSHGAGCSIDGGYVVRDPDIVEHGRAATSTSTSAQEHDPFEHPCDPRCDGRHVRRDTGGQCPISFGEDACGHLYLVAQAGGNNIFRIRSTDPPQRHLP